MACIREMEKRLDPEGREARARASAAADRRRGAPVEDRAPLSCLEAEATVSDGQLRRLQASRPWSLGQASTRISILGHCVLGGAALAPPTALSLYAVRSTES
ncbi:hypothetical protein ZWY2020_055100 [Hordeum vulgare]|nr:hypothetical protein ZWY2020_055100 [Hordeum vulgare]